jgi:hypothetical protein
MEVIAHSTLDAHLNAVPLYSFGKNFNESQAIVPILEDGGFAIAARHRVIDPIRDPEPGCSGHVEKDSNGAPVEKQPIPSRFPF